ncbi:MAG: cell division protein FtsA [Proteobacteria bacterium]|nr:cell division protein FtsA [Pseudomonadota bacterium]
MLQRNNKSPTRSRLIAALDLGTTKVCCFIARRADNGDVEIIGIGHQVSQGMRGGNIVDMDRVEATIRSVVGAAEQMAEENIHQVIVSQNGGQPQSELLSFDVAIGGHEIGDADMRRALDPAWLGAKQSEDRNIVHTIPVGYAVDGSRGVRDPRGMFGEALGVNMHVMTVGASAARNLTACVHRCNLEIEDQVLAPYASGIACLVEDEMDLGVTCIDMGGGTTTLSVFFDGEAIHTDHIPVGGDHVTNDIARGLSAPRSYAERVKTLYGSAMPSPSDDQEVIKIPLVGEDEDGADRQIPRSMLVGIIRPRLEETFEMVRAQLEAVGFDKAVGRRVVLTGGASHLTGVRELATEMLDKQVRIGRPHMMKGVAEATHGPAFTTCTGLIKFGVRARAEASTMSISSLEPPSNRFGRIGAWIRENI